MRADIHDGPEHKPLQSEAGYIDARPHSRQIDENLLQRTAGPYIRVTLGKAQSDSLEVEVLFQPDGVEALAKYIRARSNLFGTSSPNSALRRASVA